MKKINIVYFCWCNIKKNYINIIFGQLQDIINSNILDISKIYIECCCEDINRINDIEKLFQDKLKKYEYELKFHRENRYEYYGIKKLYDLAILEPEKYFIYFHSKGMFNYNNIDNRHIYEKTLTKGTFNNYKEIIKLFDNNYNIVKAALFPANEHKKEFCWFNFYWAKGIYLITCENPIVTNNRYYYEFWSESGNNSLGIVYNLFEDNFNKYTLSEAGRILNMLNGNFLRNTVMNRKNKIKCENTNCTYIKHTDDNNNGGTHCCLGCKNKGIHGPLCEKVQFK